MKTRRIGFIAIVLICMLSVSSCSSLSGFIAGMTDENAKKMREACRYGMQEAFLEGMADSGGDLSARELGEYASLACQYGNHQMVRFLVEMGADVNTTCRKGNLLIEYLDNGDVQTALYLLEKGADPNSRASDGSLAVEMAVEYNEREPLTMELLDQLYAKGAKARPETILKALDCESLDGAKRALANLRYEGEPVDILPALVYAVDGDWEIARMLAEKEEPDAQALDRLQRCAFMSADMETITWLKEMENQERYKQQNQHGGYFNIPFLSIARYGNIDGLKWLMARGENLKSDRSDILRQAAIKPEQKLIQWVMENIPLEEPEGGALCNDRCSIASDLIAFNHLDLAKSMLTGDTVTIRGMALLISSAATSQNIEALTWLLDYAAEQQIPDAQLELSDALWGSLQARYPDAQIAELLLEHGASANYQATGTTCLQQAIQRECPEIVRLLLEHGADPNVYVNPMEGGPLLHEAVRKGNLEIVRLLTEYGADLEKTYTYSQDEEPITAVEMAANYPSYHIRDYLAGKAEN